MKPFIYFLHILAFFTPLIDSAYSESQTSLRIVGRVPASVSVDIDHEVGILKARSNFPFLMSYKNEGETKAKYVVRMAKEGESRLGTENSREPLVLEIIAP